MQMTQKRKCEYAQIKPLIAGVMWESDGRDACSAQGRERWGQGRRQFIHWYWEEGRGNGLVPASCRFGRRTSWWFVVEV